MSGDSLDMSLDDLIQSNKKSGGGYNARGRGRGRGRGGSGTGPDRRFPNRGATRSTPYTVPKAPIVAWNYDMVMAGDQIGARASAIETGTKLYVSNLDYGVTNEDIKELFSEVGDLKRYSLHYDKSGRSKGTAEVVFARRQDALSSVKRYNNVQLDGKPMKIEIIGANIATPAPVPIPQFAPANFGVGFFNVAPKSGQGRGSTGGRFGRSHGGGGGGAGGGGGGRGFGRGRGRGRGRGEKVSAGDLDAELDKYHAESMQTN